MLKKDPDPIAMAFENAALTYDNAAVIEQEIGKRLLAKLESININPRHILDLGCATGAACKQLQDLYPNAHIVGLDFAFDMLKFAKRASLTEFVCANACALPFKTAQFDLIYSNCCLPSVSDLAAFFLQAQHALAIDGTIMFSTLGPDTLWELNLTPNWPDMHIIGDLLLAQNYHDPVMEMEKIVFEYSSLQDLIQDLQESGSFTFAQNQALNTNEPINVTIEVIYGIASKKLSTKQLKDAAGNTLVPVSDIVHL